VQDRRARGRHAVDKAKAAAQLARFVSLHPTNLAQKAEVIVEHFRTRTRRKIGGRAKAMVVTRSGLHAVRYKLAIDTYIAEKGYDDVRTLVAFSGTVEDDAQPYAEPQMNGGLAESALPLEFAGPGYQVLIVAEKYQTGFDQPLLHTMYVDKKLEGVRAVQTLSRLNRIYLGKTDTFGLRQRHRADPGRSSVDTSSVPPRRPSFIAVKSGSARYCRSPTAWGAGPGALRSCRWRRCAVIPMDHG
jgi:type I restriction enzyme R subunit